MAVTKLTIFSFLPVTNTAETARTTEIRNSVPFSSDLQPCSSASLSQEGTGNSEVLPSTSLLHTLMEQ